MKKGQKGKHRSTKHYTTN